MTEEEILLVVGMAVVAVAITLADLLLSLLSHRRGMAPARVLSKVAAGPEDEVAARRDAIRRRLAAIQTAGGGDLEMRD